MVDEDNQAYLIDFGLARINSQEVALSSLAAGTPGFMAPEELFNRPLTVAADLYSLGATLICLLTNTRSVDISKLIDENYRFNFQHLLIGINPRLISWLQKMVEPNLKDRYPNARLALEALKPIEVMEESKSILAWLRYYAIAAGIILTATVLVTNYLRFQPTVDRQAINIQSTPEEQWFSQIRPHCNSVEVVTEMRKFPLPQTLQGTAYAAGCYALAGKIEQADTLIQTLPESEQAYAAGVVFNIGHPVADAGDDESAGPIMDLVLQYWPEHYMALYHAGMSAYILQDYPKAKEQLEKFLLIYQNNDGWRQRAIDVLERLEQAIPPEENFVTH